VDHPDAAVDIDAVITWVDGADPAHQRKLRAVLGADAAARFAAADATRFGDCGEISYCVASLLRHAPWLRTIFIVSDAQAPGLLASLRGTPFESRVRVVDHREIFAGFEHCLPTFSNRSIEALLWRIPGLAERFIYFNDDFQLLRPVAAEDFFRGDDVVLRGHWRAAGHRRPTARLKSLLQRLLPARPAGARVARPGNHAGQEAGARLAGFAHRYLQVPHCPHPMRVSSLAAFFAAHPQALADNVGHRRRSAEQFLSTSLAAHLELAAGRAVIDNRLQVLRLKADSLSPAALQRQLARADRDPRLAFGCVQSLDQAAPAMQGQVRDWLRRRVGDVAALAAANA
jgi:hypothetical protein